MAKTVGNIIPGMQAVDILMICTQRLLSSCNHIACHRWIY